MDKAQLLVYISSDLKKKIKIKSVNEGKTIASIVEEALEKIFNK